MTMSLKVFKYLFATKWTLLCLPACRKEISNLTKIDSACSSNPDWCNSRFDRKRIIIPGKMLLCCCNLLVFKLKECKWLEVEHTHNLHDCIKFCNNKDYLERLKLNCLELNFSENNMSKINTNEANL